MSVSQTDGPDDLDSARAAAEQSESRMRQALDRLSGDRAGSDRVSGDRVSGDRLGGDRLGGDRPGGDRLAPASRPQATPQQNFGTSGPRRHRYVQDGEVPVVQISPQRDRRPGSAPTSHEPPADQSRMALVQERSSRQRVEQALERAQATIHSLETRLGHAEITQQEALEQARLHEASNARLQAELSELSARLQAAEQEVAQAQTRAQAQADARAYGEVQAPPMRRRRLRPEREVLPEPELEIPEGESFDATSFDLAFSDIVPEPPPLRPRNAKVSTRRAPRAAQAPIPVPDLEEPEPVKWWLIAPPKSKKAKPRRD